SRERAVRLLDRPASRDRLLGRDLAQQAIAKAVERAMPPARRLERALRARVGLRPAAGAAGSAAAAPPAARPLTRAQRLTRCARTPGSRPDPAPRAASSR